MKLSGRLVAFKVVAPTTALVYAKWAFTEGKPSLLAYKLPVLNLRIFTTQNLLDTNN